MVSPVAFLIANRVIAAVLFVTGLACSIPDRYVASHASIRSLTGSISDRHAVLPVLSRITTWSHQKQTRSLRGLTCSIPDVTWSHLYHFFLVVIVPSGCSQQKLPDQHQVPRSGQAVARAIGRVRDQYESHPSSGIVNLINFPRCDKTRRQFPLRVRIACYVFDV